MIVCKGGKYFIRDMGVVHTSRIKVANGLEIQLKKGSLIDLGKVVHYKIDKVVTGRDTAQESEVAKNFIAINSSTP
jgi:hypothetical protein